MRIALGLLGFFVSSMALRADESVPVVFKIGKDLPIREVVEQFNRMGEKWLKANNVPLLDEVEVSNALLLASDSFLQLEKPVLAKLAGTSFDRGRLPEGSNLILRISAPAGPLAETARDVPFVYIYLYITTLPAERRHDGVPSPEEIAKGACVPVRLTKRPPLLTEPVPQSGSK